MVPKTFQTARLTGRAACVADAPAVCEAVAESRAELQLWMPWARTEQTLEQAQAYARECEEGFFRGTLYDFNMFDAADALVCKIAAWPVAGTPETFEIGYWCHSRRSGHGFVTEAAQGLMRWAAREVGIARFRIRCDERNLASRRLAERLGFACTLTRAQDFFGEPRREKLYERTMMTGVSGPETG